MNGSQMKPLYTIDILYDGNCGFLVGITQFLKRLDRRHRIHLANMAARKFDAGIFDRSQGDLTAEIYARMPDGTWHKGLDAFREFGSAVGLRPLVLVTQLPLFRSLLDVGYRLYAKLLLRTRGHIRQQHVARAVVTTSSTGTVIRTSS
ncbi:MAG: DUF393 domain-containing protein [Planctomycetaceae bacterium]